MKFIKNVIWTFSGTIGVQLIGLLLNIILARLLTPEIFGIVNLALIIIIFVQIVQEAGLSTILIQKKEINRAMVTTTFYLNITFSLLLCSIILVFAEKIALFFGHIEIKELLYYSIIGIVIGSLGVTFRGILMRRSEFKTITIINLIAELLGVILTLIFIFYKQYMLAVGIRIMARPAFQAIFMISLCGLKEIAGKPNLSLLKEILPFSSSVLGIKTINYIKNNIDYLFIGKILGSQNLGIYTLAFQWSTIAKFYISGSVAKVLLPEISKKQHDINSVKQIFTSTVRQVSFVIFPFCIGLVLLAPEFIIVVYGQQWKNAVPILQILMVAGLLTSFGTIIGRVYEGLGKPSIELKITTISIIVFIPLLIVGSFFGLKGISYSVLFHSAVFDFVLIVKALRLLNIPIKSFVRSLIPVIYSMAFVVVFYYIIKYLFFYDAPSTVLSLVSLVLLQIILYILSSLIFNKSTIMTVLRNTCRILNFRRRIKGSI